MKAIIMIRFVGLFMALFIFSGCSTLLVQPHVSLRYDGLYCGTEKESDKGVAYWSYLRFYPDGIVIEATTEGTPEEIRAWFSREHPSVSLGKVAIRGSHVSFSAVSVDGTVDYSGEIEGDQLKLDSYSHINQYRQKDVYVFIKWNTEQDVPPDRLRSR